MRNPLAGLLLAAALAGGGVTHAQSLGEAEARMAEIDRLLGDLSDPELRTPEATEGKIIALWSRSGSETADFLLERARALIEKEDYATAIEHLTALTDHAPDFAEGWYVRATAFYGIEEFGLALKDLERTLALNPRHFGALSGMGALLEEMGYDELALRALRLAQGLNPHTAEIADAITRLQYRIGESTL